MHYATIITIVTWIHISLNVSGKSYMEPPATAHATVNFYVDTTMVIKTMDFQMVLGGEDTVVEKNGFLLDFRNGRAYSMDFVTGERHVDTLSEDWEYLASSSLKPMGDVECKDFSLDFIDSTHAKFSATVVRKDDDKVTKFHGNVTLLPIHSNLADLLTHQPPGYKNKIVEFMAIPVTTGELVMGSIMKALHGRIISKGYFMLSLESQEVINDKKYLENRMRVTKFEEVPYNEVAPLVNKFVGQK